MAVAKEKKKDLAATLAELRGKVQIGSLADFDMNVKAISTGNMALDCITGVGGLPRGRVVELFGPPSSGKTTTALQAAAVVQRAGGNVVFLDYEKSLDEKYCKALGLDPSDPSFIYMQPDSFEQGANVFRKLLSTGEVQMLICDSVASMVTENELSADTGKATMADRAKMMHQFMRQITSALHTNDCCAVFLNHVLEVVDTSPMGQQMKARGISRKTTPGGMALKFYASMRIEFKQIGNIRSTRINPLSNEKEDVVSQTKVQATVVKNKVGDPFGQAELRVRYGLGFSNAYSALDTLLAYNLVKKETGGVYRFKDAGLYPTEAMTSQNGVAADRIRGEDAFLSAMENNPEWAAVVIGMAESILQANGAANRIDGAGRDENGDEITDTDVDDLLSGDESVDEETGEIL